MKIYDCFTFYNELDLLELRLRETYDHVDVFVIAEATHTFQGKEKPLFLKENWDRFAPWHDKIRRIEITDLDPAANPWDNEAASREHLKEGLYDAEELDIIVLSDCDEILRPAALDIMRNGNRAVYGTRMPLFYFRLNYLQVHPTQWWNGASAVRFKLLQGMEQLRKMRHSIGIQENSVIMHAGWHFGWMGDDVKAREKIASFAHSELNKPEILENIDLELSIQKGHGLNPHASDSEDKHVVVEVDDYFPATVLVDKERWSKYIIPNATTKVTDLLRFGTVPR